MKAPMLTIDSATRVEAVAAARAAILEILIQCGHDRDLASEALVTFRTLCQPGNTTISECVFTDGAVAKPTKPKKRKR